jgi:uncharacterized protein (DUF1810 family)
MVSIDRFLRAQDAGEFDTALAEIRSGRKAGHWIWYVFPQLAGLGNSPMSQRYAIRDRAEAVAYLRDPTLRGRLEAITAAAATQVGKGVPIDRLMGSSIDAQKLVSSLTLFVAVARELITSERGLDTFVTHADQILNAAETQGYPPCAFTRRRLGLESPF